jgi:hypothetical protein
MLPRRDNKHTWNQNRQHLSPSVTRANGISEWAERIVQWCGEIRVGQALNCTQGQRNQVFQVERDHELKNKALPHSATASRETT